MGQHSTCRAELPLLHPQCHQAIVTVVFTPVSAPSFPYLWHVCFDWPGRKSVGMEVIHFLGLSPLQSAGRGEAKCWIGPVTPGWKGPRDNVPQTHAHTLRAKPTRKWHQVSESLAQLLSACAQGWRVSQKKKKPLCVPVQYLTAHIVEKTQFLHLLKVSHGAPSVFNLYAALYTQLYMYIEVTPIQILTYSIE